MAYARISKAILCASGPAAAITAAPAWAQADDAAVAAQEKGDENVIIVTARRREERLTDVPLSVSAISGEQLAKNGTTELTEIAQEVPNLTLEVSRGTNTTLTAFIRGVGQQDPVAGFEAGVGLYVDDVYSIVPRRQCSMSTTSNGSKYSADRGDALWPQHHWRRHQIRHRPPAGGNRGQGPRHLWFLQPGRSDRDCFHPAERELQGGCERRALSRGGFGDNLVQPGVENYNKDVWAARGTIEFEDGPLFIRLAGDYVKDNSDPRQGHRCWWAGSRCAGARQRLRYTRGSRCRRAVGRGLWWRPHHRLRVERRLTVKSITGYREDSSTTPIDFDSLPQSDLDVPAIYNNDQLARNCNCSMRATGFRGTGALSRRQCLHRLRRGVVHHRRPARGRHPRTDAQTLGDVATETWSIFGDFTYDITDQLSLSLGGRYTWDTRNSRILRTTFAGGFSDLFDGSGVPIAVTSDFTGSETFKEFTPRASLAFKPSEDHLLYFTYSKGFKGGGFDPRGQSTPHPTSMATVISITPISSPFSASPLKRSTATRSAGRLRCSTTGCS